MLQNWMIIIRFRNQPCKNYIFLIRVSNIKINIQHILFRIMSFKLVCESCCRIYAWKTIMCVFCRMSDIYWDRLKKCTDIKTRNNLVMIQKQGMSLVWNLNYFTNIIVNCPLQHRMSLGMAYNISKVSLKRFGYTLLL